MGRRPKNEFMALARAARSQLNRADKLGASLDVRMKEKQEGHDGWIPDEDWRRDFNSVTTTLQHAGNSLIRALEGNKTDLGGQTEAQLQAQLQAELVQAAPALTDEQWEKMVTARAKMKKG